MLSLQRRDSPLQNINEHSLIDDDGTFTPLDDQMDRGSEPQNQRQPPPQNGGGDGNDRGDRDDRGGGQVVNFRDISF